MSTSKIGYDDAYDLCLRECDEHGWFNRSTGLNPFTREGKKTSSFEIWEQLGRVPDRVIVPTGDGNILSGVWKGWRDLAAAGLIDRLPRMSRTPFDSISDIRPGIASTSTVSGASPSRPSNTALSDPWPRPVAPREP